MSGFSMAVDLTANDASPQFGLGQRYSTPDGKEYAYYLFNDGAGSVAAVVGNFAYLYAASGASAGETTTVTSDRTDTANVGAGVFQAVLTDGYYGWFQVGGFATLNQAATAGADGNALTVVGAGADGTLDLSAAVTDHVCAILIDADAKLVKLVNM
jgi:hypothetical protein